MGRRTDDLPDAGRLQGMRPVREKKCGICRHGMALLV